MTTHNVQGPSLSKREWDIIKDALSHYEKHMNEEYQREYDEAMRSGKDASQAAEDFHDGIQAGQIIDKLP